ncbi:MAG: hypothetical protein ACSLEL_05485 [Candidatus Malihini olakiniferum]
MKAAMVEIKKNLEIKNDEFKVLIVGLARQRSSTLNTVAEENKDVDKKYINYDIEDHIYICQECYR